VSSLAYRQTVAPTSEPLSLAEAKLHLRVDSTDEDSLIESLIVAAREYVENRTDRQLVTATYVLNLRTFPVCLERNEQWYEIHLPKPPLQSVTSVTYVDLAGNTQTLSTGDYVVDNSQVIGRILPSYLQFWPVARDFPNSVTVTYVAGYGTAENIPEGIRAAMKLIIGHLYANREAVNVGNIVNELPMAVDALLGSYAVPEVH
jgi:uncharacterized phiE125 gp8 family phage protein